MSPARFVRLIVCCCMVIGILLAPTSSRGQEPTTTTGPSKETPGQSQTIATLDTKRISALRKELEQVFGKVLTSRDFNAVALFTRIVTEPLN